MKTVLRALLAALLVLAEQHVSSQTVPGSMEVRWNEGAADCAHASQPPLQVHQYETQTFILRQSLCTSFEGNFLYLLIGANRALLIDSGAIADAKQMPLLRVVEDLLPITNGSRLPLTIVHTHRHRDHYDGDGLFASLQSVQIAPVEEEKARAFFGFKQWPKDIAQLDLGGRMVDVIPTPGHTPDHLAFYDARTGLLFSGDFLLPGRLTIDDAKMYHDSAERVAAFLNTHPLTYILGGHIELDAAGKPYQDGAQYHPNEHVLQLNKEAALQLPAAIKDFNGFYSQYPNFVLTNPLHNLIAAAVAVLVVLSFIVWGIRFVLQKRRQIPR
jgi:hydroxyacylglutathione hydrolase